MMSYLVYILSPKIVDVFALDLLETLRIASCARDEGHAWGVRLLKEVGHVEGDSVSRWRQ